jgi:hypothetical protein
MLAHRAEDPRRIVDANTLMTIETWQQIERATKGRFPTAVGMTRSMDVDPRAIRRS